MKYSYCVTSVGVTRDLDVIRDLLPSGVGATQLLEKALAEGECDFAHGAGSREGTIKISIRKFAEQPKEENV